MSTYFYWFFVCLFVKLYFSAFNRIRSKSIEIVLIIWYFHFLWMANNFIFICSWGFRWKNGHWFFFLFKLKPFAFELNYSLERKWSPQSTEEKIKLTFDALRSELMLFVVCECVLSFVSILMSASVFTRNELSVDNTPVNCLCLCYSCTTIRSINALNWIESDLIYR